MPSLEVIDLCINMKYKANNNIREVRSLRKMQFKKLKSIYLCNWVILFQRIIPLLIRIACLSYLELFSKFPLIIKSALTGVSKQELNLTTQAKIYYLTTTTEQAELSIYFLCSKIDFYILLIKIIGNISISYTLIFKEFNNGLASFVDLYILIINLNYLNESRWF